MRVSMKSVVTLVACVCIGLSTSQADTIVATDVNGLSSYATGDGLVTLNPLAAGLVPGVFSASDSFIGVDGGANANGVDDGDGDFLTTVDREAIDIVLDPTVGLSQVTFQWTRANGPLATDGIQISGFTANPLPVTSGGSGTASATYDAGLNSVFINHPWDGGNITTLDLSSLSASAGQILRITTNDSDEATPQAPMTSISYEIIPEPSTLALLLVGAGLGLIRRRR